MLAAAAVSWHAVAFYLRSLAATTRFTTPTACWSTAKTGVPAWPLLAATRQVLRNGLAVIGVSAPRRIRRRAAQNARPVTICHDACCRVAL